MKVISITQDMAKKWRAVVDFGQSSTSFKYQEEPKEEQVLIDAQNWIGIVQELEITSKEDAVLEVKIQEKIDSMTDQEIQDFIAP